LYLKRFWILKTKQPIWLKTNKPNQIFYYTRRITPKSVTSWRCTYPRDRATATQLPWVDVEAVGEPFAMLCKI